MTYPHVSEKEHRSDEWGENINNINNIAARRNYPIKSITYTVQLK